MSYVLDIEEKLYVIKDIIKNSTAIPFVVRKDVVLNALMDILDIYKKIDSELDIGFYYYRNIEIIFLHYINKLENLSKYHTFKEIKDIVDDLLKDTKFLTENFLYYYYMEGKAKNV